MMSVLTKLRRRRGRLSLLAVALTMLLAYVAGPARALPPRCADGSPPPCEGPEDPPPPPEPDPDPTTPPTSPSPTAPIPTTSTPQPPPAPPSWTLNVLSLVKDDAGLTGPVGAERFWWQEPVNAPPWLVGPPPDTTFSLTPAGTAMLDGNVLAFPDLALPAGAKMILRVNEGGSPGLLCRTPARSALPPSGTALHILVAPSTTVTAAELQEMVSGFVGPVTSGLPDGVTMNIDSATLVPQDNGLLLGLQGTINIFGTVFGFDYHLLITLVPATGPDLKFVAWVQPVGPGTVELTPANVDLGETMRVALRSRIPVLASPLVNNAIHSAPEVQWWHDDGFNVSLRRVTYSPDGLTLYPSLCRLS
jgi:hypothetical protein